MKSMTGFGQAVREDLEYRYSASIRTVNQRHLEIQLRIPEELRASEASLRAEISQFLSRGRVEVRLFVESLGERDVRVDIRRRAIDAFQASVAPLVEEGIVQGALSPPDLLRIPEAVVVELVPSSWTDENREALFEVLREAVGQVVAAREAEGASLHLSMGDRLADLDRLIGRVQDRRRIVRDEIYSALKGRIADVMKDQELDEDRVAQEVAILVEKGDVAEELDRLKSHVVQFGEVMASEGLIGKRLDFLTQEVSRELNTLSAKARDSEMLRSALDAKVICEQLREQVQNVE